MQELLNQKRINTVFVTGLALNFCVKFTALDAKKLGYNVYVIVDATKATEPEHEQATVDELKAAGIQVVRSTDLAAVGLVRQPPKLLSLLFGIPLILIASIMIILLVKFILTPTGVPESELYTTDDDHDNDHDLDLARKPLLID